MLTILRRLFHVLLIGLCGFGWALAGSSPPAAVSVEQWDVFELTLNGPAGGNPFTEVELFAQFTLGSRTVKAAGFYDGEGVYKIRFMPEAVGDWRYTTASNRPELSSKTGALTVVQPSRGNHGPVRVAHTFHFAYADGTPYKQLGTTAYSWTHRSDELEERTLKTLAAAPFNKIRMCVFPQSNAARSLRFFPFEGTPPRAWDTTRFNPAFFRHLEHRVTQLRDLGIEADLILFHPYDSIWGFNSMDAASDDRYLRYVVARLAAYRNVWWSMSNEYDFNKDKKESDWDRIFQIVRASDPYGHLRSIHNGYRIYNHTLPWVTHASIQNGAAVLDPERAVLYRDVYRKPIVYDEVKYEGNSSRRWGQLSAEEMVLRFWNGLVAGSYVGHSEIFGSVGGSEYWLSSGGEFRGQSVPRLAFLKQVMEAGPQEGFEPIDKWQERRTGGKPGEHYLVYFGLETPTVWPFELYKTSQQEGQQEKLQDGLSFQAEIIDTWNMTITPVPGVFVAKKRDDYVFADKNGSNVLLPGRPYMAIRIRRVGAALLSTLPGAQSKPDVVRAHSTTNAPDAIVAADGSGQYTSLQEAISRAPMRTGSADPRWVIHVKPGTYRERIYVQRERGNIAVIGEDAATTIITYDLHAQLPGPDGKPIGTFRTPTVQVDGDGMVWEGVTIANSAGEPGPRNSGPPVEQAVALRVDGDRVVFRRCRFLGWQDTILLNRGRHYFVDSYIEGHVDFIFGGATAVFDRCHIHCLRDGYITAASTPQSQAHGFVFTDCRITGTREAKTYLGRPWRIYAKTVFIRTEMSSVVRPEGWHNWNKPEAEKTAFYAEFGSTGTGASQSTRVRWARPLTARQIAALTPEKVLSGADGWNPKKL